LSPNEERSREQQNRPEDNRESPSHAAASGVVPHIRLQEHAEDEYRFDHEQNPTNDYGDLHSP